MTICVCQESKSPTPRWRVKQREPIGVTFRYLVVCLSCEWEWWVSADEGAKYQRLSTEEAQAMAGVAKKTPKDDRVCSIHKLVADVGLKAEGKVLLVRYNNVEKYDWQKGWFLPDDQLNLSEHPLDAAKRILKEQLGLEAIDLELGQIESFGGEQGSFWHLVFHYKAELGVKPNLALSTNIKSSEWFPTEQMPKRDTVAHDGWAIDIIGDIFKPK